jgi:hypothetical protein
MMHSTVSIKRPRPPRLASIRRAPDLPDDPDAGSIVAGFAWAGKVGRDRAARLGTGSDFELPSNEA